jgi:hypothetical protein
MEGYIKLYRSLLDNPMVNKSDYASLWIHLLLMANHKETTFIFNNKKETLKAGQLITGRKKLSKITGVSQSQVYKILKYLEMEQQIEQQSNSHFTTITILNWDKYQGNGTTKEQPKRQLSNSQVTTEEQLSNTYKNDKNVKNDNKKDIYASVFNFWNSKQIIVHKQLSTKATSLINAKLQAGYSEDDIKRTIFNYHVILTDEEYYFNYRWTLENFLNPTNFEKFISAEVAHNNYLRDGKGKR